MSELLTPGDGSDSLKGRRVGAPERRDDVDFALILWRTRVVEAPSTTLRDDMVRASNGQEILVPRTLALSRSTDSRRLELQNAASPKPPTLRPTRS